MDIDKNTIRRLLQKIFVSCDCNKEIKLNETFSCTGHDIIFPVDETIATLDIYEEKIITLLYHLELHPKQLIKVLPTTYMMAKISSNSGIHAIEVTAQTVFINYLYLL